MTHPEQSQPNEGIRFELSPRRLPSLLRLGFILRRAHKKQDLDQETPGLVALNPAASAILTKAHMLANDEREDQEAISELRTLSHDDPRTLREAALGARQRGQHHESSWADLTHRLIQAAIHNTPVLSLTEEERSYLKALDDFSSMPVNAKWDTLTDLEPRLLKLVAEARAKQFGSQTRKPLNDRLATIIGPQSDAENRITQSRLAFNAARRYLLEIIEA